MTIAVVAGRLGASRGLDQRRAVDDGLERGQETEGSSRFAHGGCDGTPRPVRLGGRIGRGCYRGDVTTRHVRFALHDVTFGGVSLPGATVDCWDDSEGHSRWSARIVTRVGPALDEGELTGRTADGRSLSGHAVVADRQVGAGGRRETLVELHGSGELAGLVVPSD